MGRLAYFVVDAFSGERFSGNPAGVVMDADGLAVADMRRIAGEINCSETAFVMRPETPEADFRVRWFTPTVEVDMCGHATLAAAHAWLSRGAADDAASLRVQTRSGLLEVAVERLAGSEPGRLLWLTLPRPRLFRKAVDQFRLAELCGLDRTGLVRDLPIQQTNDRDLIVPVRDFQVLQSASPRFEELGEFCRLQGVRGVCLVTTNAVSAAVASQSRFFAPAIGINEDPVTGSVHGPLGVYLALHDFVTWSDGEAVIQCLQTPASGRVGIVWVHLRRDDPSGDISVRIGGQCVTAMEGWILLD